MSQAGSLITEVDESILHALARFHYLTAAQASRLFYPNLRDENRYMQRRFRKLIDAGHVLRLGCLPVPSRGSSPYVYTLARKGREYLKGLGITVEDYYRPSEERRAVENRPFMLHRLATIDVLIALERLCRDSEQVQCLQMLTERELRHGAVRVDVPPSPQSTSGAPRRVAVIPDAWFQVSLAGGPPIAVAVEVDRGTEEQKVWREKIAAYSVWVNGPYQAAFASDYLTIAVACPSERRRSVLMDWTMRELRTRNIAHFGQLFVFTATSPVEATPQRFFFSKVWREAGAVKPTSLLDGPVIKGDEQGVVYQLA
jgi:hypothetical protein